MESTPNGIPMFETFAHCAHVLKYYEKFDIVYLLLSNLCTGARKMMTENIEMFCTLMAENRRVYTINKELPEDISELAGKIPFGLFQVEYHISNNFNFKSLFTLLEKIQEFRYSDIEGWSDAQNDSKSYRKHICFTLNITKIILKTNFEIFEEHLENLKLSGFDDKIYINEYWDGYALPFENTKICELKFKTTYDNSSITECLLNDKFKVINKLAILDSGPGIDSQMETYFADTSNKIESLELNGDCSVAYLDALSDYLKSTIKSIRISNGSINSDIIQKFTGSSSSWSQLKRLELNQYYHGEENFSIGQLASILKAFKSPINFCSTKSIQNKDIEIVFKNCFFAYREEEGSDLTYFYSPKVRIAIVLNKNFSDFSINEDFLSIKKFYVADLKNASSNLSPDLISYCKKMFESSQNSTHNLIFKTSDLEDLNLTCNNYMMIMGDKYMKKQLLSLLSLTKRCCMKILYNSNDQFINYPVDFKYFIPPKKVSGKSAGKGAVKSKGKGPGKGVVKCLGKGAGNNRGIFAAKTKFEIETAWDEGLTKEVEVMNVKKFVCSWDYYENVPHLLTQLCEPCWYQNLEHLYVYLKKSKDLIKLMINLKQCENMVFLKLIIGNFHPHWVDEAAEAIADFLKSKHHKLETVIIKDNKCYDNLTKYSSCMVNIELPAFLCDKVRTYM